MYRITNENISEYPQEYETLAALQADVNAVMEAMGERPLPVFQAGERIFSARDGEVIGDVTE